MSSHFTGRVNTMRFISRRHCPQPSGANGTPYAHVVSRDLAHWDEWPIVVEPGESGAPDDLSCFTGSVNLSQFCLELFSENIYKKICSKNKSVLLCDFSSMLHLDNLEPWRTLGYGNYHSARYTK
jgi:hypothetical protein